MDDRGDSLAQAYQPSNAEAGPSAPIADSTLSVLVVRLHLVVLALALAWLVIPTTSMQVELFDPGPTSSRESYALALSKHAFVESTLLMPALIGLLPLFVLPWATATRSRGARGLLYLGFALWCVEVISCWAIFELRVLPPIAVFLYATPIATVAYAASLVLTLIGGGQPALHRMRALWSGLLLSGLAAMFVGILGAYDIALSMEGSTTQAKLSVSPPDLVLVGLPVMLAAEVALIQARAGASVPTRGLGVVLVGTWGSYAAEVALAPGPEAELGLALIDVLVALVLLFALVRLGRLLASSLLDPVALAVSLALVATAGMGITWTLLATLSPDVHLHDTYLVLAPLHFTGTATVLLLVAACLHRAPALFGREPRRGMGRAGVLALGGGLLTSSVAMAVLGQQGMPRRYFTYIPQFQDLHQCVGLGGLLAAVGLVLVVLAFATGRRATA